MLSYILRRLLLMIPTLFGILTITFMIIQFVPGGPLDQIRQTLEGGGPGGAEVGGGAAPQAGGSDGVRRRGISQEDLDRLKAIYHLDRPLLERYLRTFIWFSRSDKSVPLRKALLDGDNWDGMLLFKFGDSFYRNRNVLGLIGDALPVSISLGFWSFLLTYPTCILLGIAKGVREGTKFDAVSSVIILAGNSIPGFVMAILLIVFFGPGEKAFIPFIPLDGLTSSGSFGYEDWSFFKKTLDYFQHLAAPVFCLSIGSLAVLTILTKNSILEEIRKQYTITAKAKGLSNTQVLFRHILRNAMLPLVTSFPSRFVAIFFTGSLLIERIFKLDGLGRLSYDALITRDYPIVMGSLFIMTLIALLTQLITDICYVVVDPRISFSGSQ
ncbi:MAG: ABC transporter permease subunit [Lentisphaeria bacterium]|nr:ABC transporter permease subunit [Lentisphaeria bacterium]